MSDDPLSSFKSALVGRFCVVRRAENGWSFDFGGGAGLFVEAPWRIVSADGVMFACTDDGQLFGLPEPMDGEETANKLLEERGVISVSVDSKTADLTFEFRGDVRLDVFNSSCAYEAWHASFDDNGKNTHVVGLGGGDIASWQEPGA